MFVSVESDRPPSNVTGLPGIGIRGEMVVFGVLAAVGIGAIGAPAVSAIGVGAGIIYAVGNVYSRIIKKWDMERTAQKKGQTSPLGICAICVIIAAGTAAVVNFVSLKIFGNGSDSRKS